MGFKPERTTYKLRFAAPALEGLVIRTRAATVDEALDVDELRTSLEGQPTRELIHKMTGLFIQFVVEWNLLGDDDEPLPIAAESLIRQELGFLLAVLFAWAEAITDVPVPLDSGSTPGPQPPPLEASLPMETLSPSLAS